MLANLQISRLSSTEKVEEALRRSLPYVPGDAKAIVESMLKPETLAIIAGTIVVWAGSHFFGVGEIVDIILLGVGVIAVGFSIFDGADELYSFATKAVNAKTDKDLDVAGQHFAKAVTILGISTIQVILLHGQGKVVVKRGMPVIRPRIKVGVPPPSGNKLILSRTDSIPVRLPGNKIGYAAGKTSEYGVITIARDQSLTEQRITLYHELVHRYFSPRVGPLRKLRAELKISSYARSALLKYLEEALAEGYGQLRVNGLAKALGAYRFPIKAGYVTVSRMAAEGRAIGTIILGGVLFHVSISHGPIPVQ